MIEAITGEHLQKIVLYGSCVREDNHPDSDIDIMILVDLDTDKLRKCVRIMSGTSIGDSVPLFQQCSNKNALVSTEANH